MESNDTRLEFLLQRFREGLATAEELEELQQRIDKPEAAETLQKLWEQMPRNVQFFDEDTSQKMLSSILSHKLQHIPEQRPAKRRFLIPAIAAALVLLISGTWAYLYFFQAKTNTPTVMAEQKITPAAILPGDNKAILILADNRTILLDSAQNGNLAKEGDAVISKANGQVVYTGTNNEDRLGNAYNKLITPKGGQYQLVLSDGTRVWMNAASSLRYPSTFNGEERQVELTGEAYFEVAKDASRPFKVKLNGQEVEVLGTHFNIMSYENENAIHTTLLEGAVKVNGTMNTVRLSPGQQASGRSGSLLSVVEGVDVEEVVAWKNGYFQFNQTNLDVLMRQIERWYDVQVVYEGKVPNRQFGGKISRNSDITDVLKILELTRVGFKIEGKKIIVSDNS